ncbi:MAG: dihydropteroate synthase [Candidatus Korobacteraceae bacterium]
MRPHFEWRLGSRTLRLGERTWIMGVVNVTPDSFFDGGRYAETRTAVDHALRLLDEGADIIDVGGESTRPGAQAGSQGGSQAQVTAEMELRRVIPVIAELKRLRPDALISVDTYKSDVARAAVEAGAEIVNDISGLCWDAEMAGTLAALKCGVVLMHVRGRPEEWRSLPALENAMEVVSDELQERARAAMATGIERSRIVLDPGFGFGKNFEENYPLLARFDEFHKLGFPLLAGTSRKSFIGKAVGRGEIAPPEQRLFGSVAAAVISILKGAHIVRVHDVRETVEAAAAVDAVMG